MRDHVTITRKTWTMCTCTCTLEIMWLLNAVYRSCDMLTLQQELHVHVNSESYVYYMYM